MTKEIAKRIVRGITDKIEATTDIDDWAEFWGFTRDDYEEFLEMAIKALDQEPQQRTGRWVSQPHQKDRECSICGHCEPYKFADKEAEIFNYCPYCGCIMKGESE